MYGVLMAVTSFDCVRCSIVVLNPYDCTQGTAQAKMEPYFPFGKAVERYVRSYAALGISYKGAEMNLDLLERKNKHDNGFCHWPKVAWVKPDGTFQPSTTNFTSCADPKAVGSGLAALQVLLHEGGHAAHFAVRSILFVCVLGDSGLALWSCSRAMLLV